jgi:hypothetical protein
MDRSAKNVFPRADGDLGVTAVTVAVLMLATVRVRDADPGALVSWWRERPG